MIVCRGLNFSGRRARYFEIYFFLLEGILLAAEQDACLLLCVTFEHEQLFALILVGLWSPQEVNQVNERDFTEEAPHKDLIVLMFVSLFHFILGVLIAEEGVHIVREVRRLARLNIYRVTLGIQ